MSQCASRRGIQCIDLVMLLSDVLLPDQILFLVWGTCFWGRTVVSRNEWGEEDHEGEDEEGEE